MKQVIDITTPDEEEVKEQFPAVLAVAKPKRVSSAKKKTKKKNGIKVCFTIPKVVLKIPLIIGVALLLLGGAFLYLTLQAKAEINIKPVLEPITIEDEIQISSTQAQVDFEKKLFQAK